ncbi:MAG: hypothetical protein QW315_00020 [Candidatus Hadarchaeum sp.]
MKLVHYQTLESVTPDELKQLIRIKEKFNENRSYWERIKLWRKSDILDRLEPSGARWGFSRVKSERDKMQLLSVLRMMSLATPRLTWIMYDESNGGCEMVLKGGSSIA